MTSTATRIPDGFGWNDFLKEARISGDELIGRRDELRVLTRWFEGRGSRCEGAASLGWMHGGPGLGKSVLMTRLAEQLSRSPADDQGLYYHRFRAGDPRNNRRAFLLGLQAALHAWPPLTALEPPGEDADDAHPLEADVRMRLAAVADLAPSADKTLPPRFVVLVDGLDECAVVDRALPRLITELALSGALWLVASRPDASIAMACAPPLGESLFPDGLPPMTAADIRAMLLDGLDHDRHRLVERDQENELGTCNPFVDAVVAGARGLPLYVHLVIEELNQGSLTVQDEARLPAGLTAYYDSLLANVGDAALRRDLQRIVALLACAQAPLTAKDLADLVPATPNTSERPEFRISRTQAVGHALLRPSTTASGEAGLTLYHHSLREHVLNNESLANCVTEARTTLWQRAMTWQRLPAGHLRRHLLRWGIHYALSSGEAAAIEAVQCCLTDFAYSQARCRELQQGADVNDLVQSFQQVLHQLPTGASRERFAIWARFFREHAHVLRRGCDHWPTYKILLQLAVEHADDSPVTQAAERWLAQGHCDWVWLRKTRRPAKVRHNGCLAVLEGHCGRIQGAKALANGRVVSWDGNAWLGLWDVDSGSAVAMLEHDGAVKGADVMPNGTVLSWSADAKLRLWNPTTGELVRVLQGHEAGVSGVQCLPNEQLLSWSTDGAIILWDLDSGRVERRIRVNDGPLADARLLSKNRLLSFSFDGTLCLWCLGTGEGLWSSKGPAGCVDEILPIDDHRIVFWRYPYNWEADTNDIYVWDIETGKQIAALTGHTHPISSVSLLPNGSLVSTSWDRSLRVWNFDDHCTTRIVESAHQGTVDGARLLSTAQLLTWSDDRTLGLWDLETGTCLRRFEGHTSIVEGATALSDDRLLSWGYDNTLRLWDLQTGDLLNTFAGHTCTLRGACATPDGRLVSWADDGTLRVWDPKSTPSSNFAHSNDRPLRDLPGSRTLTTNADGTMRLWDANSGECLASFEGHTAAVDGAEVLNVKRLLSWCDTTLRTWDLETGRMVRTLEGVSNPFARVVPVVGNRVLTCAGRPAPDIGIEYYDVCLWDVEAGALQYRFEGQTDSIRGSPELLSNNRVMMYQNDGSIRLWRLGNGEHLVTLGGHPTPVQGRLELSRRRLLTWSGDLRVWDLRTGALLQVMKPGQDAISNVKRLPDNRVLSIPWVPFDEESDSAMHVWDRDSGTLIATLRGHTKDVGDVQILSDGRLLSWSWDHTLRLWDLAEGRLLHTFEGHEGIVCDAQILRDGRLLSSAQDNTFRVWDLQTGELLHTLTTYASQLSHARLNPNGEMLAWSDNRLLLSHWNLTTGELLDWMYVTDAARDYPRWLAERDLDGKLKSGPMVAWGDVKKAGISRFESNLGLAVEWHADAVLTANRLSDSGVLRVELNPGSRECHLTFLQLYRGSQPRRLEDAVKESRIDADT